MKTNQKSKSSVELGFLFPAAAMIFLQFVNIGRPQDIFYSIRTIRPGMISIGLSFLVVIAFWHKLPEIKLFGFKTITKLRNIFIYMVLIVPICMIPPKSLNYLVNEFSLKVMYVFCFYKFVNSLRFLRLSIIVMILSSFLLSMALLLMTNGASRASIGTTYDPNDIALLFVSILPLAIFFAQSEKGILRIIAVLTVFTSLIAIGLTQSRGAYLGLLILFIVWLLQTKSYSKVKKHGKSILFGVIVIVFAVTVMPDTVLDRFKSATVEDATGSGRLTVWPRIVQMMIWHPQGVGAGNFTSAYGRHLSAGDFKSTQDAVRERAWVTAHNSYLLVGGELGFIGLFMYMNWLWSMIKTLALKKKSIRDSGQAEVFYQYCSMLQLGLVGFLVPAFFLSQSFSYILLTYVAYIATLERLIENEISKNPEEPASTPLLAASGRFR